MFARDEEEKISKSWKLEKGRLKVFGIAIFKTMVYY